ncbi:MAG TPA: N-acetylmuramic acid 6-phosphate etherase [Virgibacillus sp.]|nr:N-acetylmuramic acid 6-phosphate etherase [Virgibacillus sp.]
MKNLSTLATEMRNENSMNIDTMSTKDVLATINNEDLRVAEKVRDVLPDIEKAVEAVYHALAKGGKLFYVGAGTSGRLGILDAVECPPTFSTPPDLVQGVIAGGSDAIYTAVEGAEDDEAEGARDLKARDMSERDVVVGIAASGRTPYVLGALKYAQGLGATAISLSSNINTEISQHADVQIEVETGPEVLTGSTRMKAASAHKMILNMITTSSMIKIGKVYENLMVDVKVSNKKLKERAKNIIATVTQASYKEISDTLEKTDNQVKPAIVMLMGGVSHQDAERYIEAADGYVRKAVELAKRDT